MLVLHHMQSHEIQDLQCLFKPRIGVKKDTESLPAPCAAMPMTSLPLSKTGKTLACRGVGFPSFPQQSKTFAGISAS
jgi:hypothetical protein